MKRNWQHRSFVIAATLSGAFLTGSIWLSSSATAAPADQPSSLAPANEQPAVPKSAPADTGTKPLPGPPNPFDETPTPASTSPSSQGTPGMGRSSLAQPAPLQGPLGAPAPTEPSKSGAQTPPQGPPNPFGENPAPSPAAPSAPGAEGTGRSSLAQPAPLQGPLGTPSTPSSTPPAKPEAQGRMPGPNPFETPTPSEPQPEQPNSTTPSTPSTPSTTEQHPETPSPSAEQPSEETYTPSQQAVKVGITLLQKEKYDESLQHFDEALKLDPAEGAAYFYKGVAYRMLNRFDDAIDAFTSAIDLTVDDLDAQTENYLRRGIVWFYKGEYGIAWQDFDQAAVFAKDEDPRPDFWKGLASARQGKWLAAANSYAVSLEHDDRYLPAFVNLGLTYLVLDEPKKATYCFDQAIRLDPHDAANYFKRGIAQVRAENLREAVDSYTQAIHLNPNYAEAYLNRSVANRRLGDQQQAEKDEAAAIKINPDIQKQLTGTG